MTYDFMSHLTRKTLYDFFQNVLSDKNLLNSLWMKIALQLNSFWRGDEKSMLTIVCFEDNFWLKNPRTILTPVAKILSLASGDKN